MPSYLGWLPFVQECQLLPSVVPMLRINFPIFSSTQPFAQPKNIPFFPPQHLLTMTTSTCLILLLSGTVLLVEIMSVLLPRRSVKSAHRDLEPLELH
jgi:hypothetical protein